MGAAADANESGSPNRLTIPAYTDTLGTQYNMLEPENAMKWGTIRPSQPAFNFSPGDQLVAFAQAHQMAVRGHNLCWWSYNPAWVTNFAATATPADMASLLQTHINTVVTHYKGQVFAWDVVNEAVTDSATGLGTDLRNSIWLNQPGIGVTGTGYIEQAFRWAHAADPDALLFYNDYNIETQNKKFLAVYNMAKDFVARGVPIHGIGIQMHIDLSGYPDTAGLTKNIQMLAALGLQVHITEMDVKLKVDSTGTASTSDLQAQAQTYQRILTVCLQNPACTAFQTWGFTDSFSWIPSASPGYGAALPFDKNYQPKPAVAAMLDTMQTVPPVLNAAAIVDAASYQGGAVAPGELVTIYQANDGPANLLGAQLDSNGLVAHDLGGTQVLFDGIAAPLVYALAGQVSAIVPFEVAGKSQTVVQYVYNGLKSNTVTMPVVSAKPGIFAQNSSGTGPGSVTDLNYALNTAAHPASAGDVLVVFATGGGTVSGGATDGAIASVAGSLSAGVTATIGNVPAVVSYAGPAPSEVNGVFQVNLKVPSGVQPGEQPLVITVGQFPSQSGITVAIK
jgi:uncharacterized protein (TIGR03437 family)